jgi:hypothetical protein
VHTFPIYELFDNTGRESLFRTFKVQFSFKAVTWCSDQLESFYANLYIESIEQSNDIKRIITPLHLVKTKLFGKYCLFLLAVGLFTLPIFPSGYQASTGIENGDVVDLDHIGKFANGTVFSNGTIPNAKLSPGQFLDGFYIEVISMKIGETKTFDVPPELGYTDPDDERTGHFVGLTLTFTVTILRLVQNIRGNDPSLTQSGAETDSGGGLASTLWNVVKWVGGIGLGILGILAFRSYIQKQTITGCVHCKSLGKTQVSEGKCGKCGTSYCRASFSRGCPNCKSNTFIPYS